MSNRTSTWPEVKCTVSRVRFPSNSAKMMILSCSFRIASFLQIRVTYLFKITIPYAIISRPISVQFTFLGLQVINDTCINYRLPCIYTRNREYTVYMKMYEMYEIDESRVNLVAERNLYRSFPLSIKNNYTSYKYITFHYKLYLIFRRNFHGTLYKHA